MQKPPGPTTTSPPGQSASLSLSGFINEKITLLLNRYSISYTIDNNRIEYRIFEKQNAEEISFSLIFCLNKFSRQLQVSKFYPGLYRQPDSKYLSAATFLLLTHHCATQFSLDQHYAIFLQCHRTVFEDFYSSLTDFSFEIIREINGDNVDVSSPYQPIPVITSMIIRDEKEPDFF